MTSPQDVDDRDVWSVAAREVLTGVAQRYRAVITYRDLATHVQESTGVHTDQLQHHWIGDVLTRVASECDRRGEPDLSSLCVNAQGSVGEGYRKVLAQRSSPTPDDLDAHAAQVRLECYREAHAAGLPEDGGRPALTPKLEASRSRARLAAARDRVPPICPTCHMAFAANGSCDNCD